MTAERTGHCFDDAGTFLLVEGRDWTLVHGIPTLTVHPFKRYRHAWVEKNGIVRDLSKRADIPAVFYYAFGKIDPQECKRYSLDDLRRMITEYEHWGPWELPDDIL